ncbi:aldo/keto reductase [Candidatus Protochlamydia phocaeensis]|uniref:aldo/keto reductase n=1 Tax=Candidatus Protochlamydia phocaeensis TaxID=1414722 RepID=UPI0008383791|nr:aldo/keto reductase [Candidatus Protochlamydia phocaeensis]
MDYRQLGKSGIRLSEISFGSWITFGANLDLNGIRQCMRAAFDQGVNYFDTAEAYGGGAAELLLGEVLRDYVREDVVISTKIYWGGHGTNQTGLSWKRMIEGTKNSLRRLQLDYVDLLLCHRADPLTPIEETVRAMDVLIKSGLVFYWGTSEWKRSQIEEACQLAKEIGATPPIIEQPEYNLFHRNRVEQEYKPLYTQYGIGLTTWSPLDSGILTGKYNEEIPAGSRLARHKELQDKLTLKKIEKVKALEEVSKELNCTLAQLAIAWCLKNPDVGSVIIGATNIQQLQDNLKATSIKHRLVDEVMEKIENILKEPLPS